MGNTVEKKSSFNPQKQGWKLKQRIDNVGLWQNRNNPQMQLQQYPFYINDEHQMSKEIALFFLRKDHPTLVATRYFSNQQTNDICSNHNKGGLFIQRIPIRLSNITDIPFPDILHLYSQTLQACILLKKQFGCFPIREDNIGVNKQGVVKTWLNSQLDKGYPITTLPMTQFVMARNIVDIIECNTDCDTLPPLDKSISKFIFRYNEALSLKQALSKIQQYANIYNQGVIPSRLDCIYKMGGTEKLIKKVEQPQHYYPRQPPIQQNWMHDHYRNTPKPSSNQPNYKTDSIQMTRVKSIGPLHDNKPIIYHKKSQQYLLTSNVHQKTNHKLKKQTITNIQFIHKDKLRKQSTTPHNSNIQFDQKMNKYPSPIIYNQPRDSNTISYNFNQYVSPTLSYQNNRLNTQSTAILKTPWQPQFNTIIPNYQSNINHNFHQRQPINNIPIKIQKTHQTTTKPLVQQRTVMQTIKQPPSYPLPQPQPIQKEAPSIVQTTVQQSKIPFKETYPVEIVQMKHLQSQIQQLSEIIQQQKNDKNKNNQIVNEQIKVQSTNIFTSQHSNFLNNQSNINNNSKQIQQQKENKQSNSKKNKHYTHQYQSREQIYSQEDDHQDILQLKIASKKIPKKQIKNQIHQKNAQFQEISQYNQDLQQISPSQNNLAKNNNLLMQQKQEQNYTQSINILSLNQKSQAQSYSRQNQIVSFQPNSFPKQQSSEKHPKTISIPTIAQPLKLKSTQIRFNDGINSQQNSQDQQSQTQWQDYTQNKPQMINDHTIKNRIQQIKKQQKEHKSQNYGSSSSTQLLDQLNNFKIQQANLKTSQQYQEKIKKSVELNDQSIIINKVKGYNQKLQLKQQKLLNIVNQPKFKQVQSVYSRNQSMHQNDSNIFESHQYSNFKPTYTFQAPNSEIKNQNATFSNNYFHESPQQYHGNLQSNLQMKYSITDNNNSYEVEFDPQILEDLNRYKQSL